MMPAAAPVVLDARPPRRRIVLAMTICIAVGTLAVLDAVLGGVAGGEDIAKLVIGALFLLIGLAVASMFRRMMRPHTLHFEPAGIRWDDPQACSWAVRWEELAGVECYLSVTGSTWYPGMRGKPGAHGLLFLRMIPTEPSFALRHPEMAHLLGIAGAEQDYCQSIGPAPDRAAVVEQGVRAFRPQLYRGLRKN